MPSCTVYGHGTGVNKDVVDRLALVNGIRHIADDDLLPALGGLLENLPLRIGETAPASQSDIELTGGRPTATAAASPTASAASTPTAATSAATAFLWNEFDDQRVRPGAAFHISSALDRIVIHVGVAGDADVISAGSAELVFQIRAESGRLVGNGAIVVEGQFVSPTVKQPQVRVGGRCSRLDDEFHGRAGCHAESVHIHIRRKPQRGTAANTTLIRDRAHIDRFGDRVIGIVQRRTQPRRNTPIFQLFYLKSSALIQPTADCASWECRSCNFPAQPAPPVPHRCLRCCRSLAFLTAIIAYEGQMEPARLGGLVQYSESSEGNGRPLQVILAGNIRLRRHATRGCKSSTMAQSVTNPPARCPFSYRFRLEQRLEDRSNGVESYPG
jgi:hypothetical protein